MQEADLTATRMSEWIQSQGVGAGNSRFLMDDNLIVSFSIEPKLNLRESDKQQRPVYEDAEFIEIRVPGNSTNIVKRMVTDMDKRRFQEKYDRWKETGESTNAGTSLEALRLTKSQIAELKYFGIQSVEQLATISDANAQNFRAMQALKAKAKQFLEEIDGAVKRSEMEREMRRLQAQIAKLQGAQAQAEAQKDEDGEEPYFDEPKPTSKRRGRPPLQNSKRAA